MFMQIHLENAMSSQELHHHEAHMQVSPSQPHPNAGDQLVGEAPRVKVVPFGMPLQQGVTSYTN